MPVAQAAIFLQVRTTSTRVPRWGVVAIVHNAKWPWKPPEKPKEKKFYINRTTLEQTRETSTLRLQSYPPEPGAEAGLAGVSARAHLALCSAPRAAARAPETHGGSAREAEDVQTRTAQHGSHGPLVMWSVAPELPHVAEATSWAVWL